MLLRVVLALDEPGTRRRLRRLIAQADSIVESVPLRSRPWDQLVRRGGDLLVVSRALVPEPATEAISSLRSLPESPVVVVVTDEEDPEDRARLLAGGCYAVLHVGVSNEVLRDAFSAILGRRRQEAEETLGVKRGVRKPRLSDFVSASLAMRAFMNLTARVVASDTSLLVLGETGVGKEHLARAIHAESPRSSGPFVAVNCGALPESLLESELFGHEEGAFTGATRSRRGWFELAHRGTIFLDEVGELPRHLQVKLLHVLQAHEVHRVGSEAAIGVDVRVMAATNRDIAAEVEAGAFRRDLYYRLSVVTLEIPPLRERVEDIPALAESYIGYFSHINRRVTGIAPEALEALQRYSWPGNVRELINIIERAMLLCNGEEVTLADLPEAIRGAVAPGDSERFALRPAQGDGAVPDSWLAKPLRDVRRRVLTQVERSYLAALLQATGGRIGETARRAGIDPRSLYEKMKHYGLRKESFRPPPTL